MSVNRIVITGGPCGGKTTCLSTLEQKLTQAGYKVIVVNEAATEMMLSGFSIPELGVKKFENLLVDWQVAKEDIALQAAETYKKSVIIFDRGIPDCMAYMDKNDYLEAIQRHHLTPESVNARYDAVLHLVTAADGAEKFYTCANNLARQEKDYDSARLADKKTQQAYVGHPHLRIIDNSTDFANKVQRLCGEVFSALGEPVPLEIERKFLIKRPGDEFLKHQGATQQKITQAYLTPRGQTERRIRQRGTDSDFTYYYTEKTALSPLKRIERERKISKNEYLNLLTEAQQILHKNRWCFLDQKLYFELDTFEDNPELALLEIELTQENQEIKLPKWCQVIKEVTEDSNYRNTSIAEKGFPKLSLEPNKQEIYQNFWKKHPEKSPM